MVGSCIVCCQIKAKHERKMQFFLLPPPLKIFILRFSFSCLDELVVFGLKSSSKKNSTVGFESQSFGWEHWRSLWNISWFLRTERSWKKGVKIPELEVLRQQSRSIAALRRKSQIKVSSGYWKRNVNRNAKCKHHPSLASRRWKLITSVSYFSRQKSR